MFLVFPESGAGRSMELSEGITVHRQQGIWKITVTNPPPSLQGRNTSTSRWQQRQRPCIFRGVLLHPCFLLAQLYITAEAAVQAKWSLFVFTGKKAIFPANVGGERVDSSSTLPLCSVMISISLFQTTLV